MCCNHSDPFIVWAFIVGGIVVLVLFGIVSSNLRNRKIRRLRREVMPVVDRAIRAGVRYNVFLSNGTVFRDVQVLGLTDAPVGRFVDFPLESWLVLAQMNGKRVFIKPGSVRLFEEL
jgi:hypothetical protein